ncbi:MAG: diacylglycerol kinase family protein [Candidatus Omnitrophica bacterium]|jgi:diacylglycerol kinase (ATP)|nr:diacylglycerol kinase family protein [Candidatus Omnitrophota bacterium]
MAHNKLIRRILGLRGFWESLKFALRGMLYLFAYHRNMRIIFTTGIIVFFIGLFIIKLSGLELAVLCITITVVFIAEIFNTAIELVLDMTQNKYHTLIKLIKDIAAGVVLIASLNALAVGLILFIKKLLV